MEIFESFNKNFEKTKFDFIFGVLLGDAHCFEYVGKKTSTAQLKFGQSKEKHKENKLYIII